MFLLFKLRFKATSVLHVASWVTEGFGFCLFLEFSRFGERFLWKKNCGKDVGLLSQARKTLELEAREGLACSKPISPKPSTAQPNPLSPFP